MRTRYSPHQLLLAMPKLELPTKSLALSCRSIAYEIRAGVLSLPSSERFAIATIVFSPYGFGELHIRRAPCPVVDLKMLRVEVILQAQTSQTYFLTPWTARAGIEPGALSACIENRAKFKLFRHSFLGNASALERFEVHVRFPSREACIGQSRDEYDKAMQQIKTGLDADLISGALSPSRLSPSTATIISIKYSIDK